MKTRSLPGAALAGLSRRSFALRSIALTLLLGSTEAKTGDDMADAPIEMADAPIELGGNWGAMLPASVLKVLGRARIACCDGMRLLSDRQPSDFRVERHTDGPPAIWLHDDPPTTAIIVVDIGERDWSKLAYQFGHELGHVVANSWQADAVPRAPCQWIEEALAEAFSIRGLGVLAVSWRAHPLFGDSEFSDAIASYRHDIIKMYEDLGARTGMRNGFPAWFRQNRKSLESDPELSDLAKSAAVTFIREYMDAPGSIEGLGALNRWPERGALELDRYLAEWQNSCVELGASARLPMRLRTLMGIC